MRTLLTTQEQNSYRELIVKEAYTRFNWKMKYGKDHPFRFAPRKSKTANLTTAPKVTLPPVVRAPEKKKEAPVLQPSSQVPLMRPISPRSKEIFYNGLSKEGKGCSQYLKRRMQKMPEERFYYPLLSSWEYGWRLGDYENDYKSPINGKSAVVRSTFYARNGIFNIPSATDHLG
ncbi:protein SPMIP1 [Clarias gariepinus]|uniref:protein ATP6V1FNB n=1 Tax=Clarias gariepinus TaxID=13013 RepID=UPI00234D41FD|nr:protein ATP6V1FNB [Clarias gariepinus]XP_053339546.1 protein ATP6V1FNB [Clarias gariepinus]